MTEEAAKYITEADFQAAVIELAEAQGWKVAHFHDSRRWVPEKIRGVVVHGKWVGDAQAKGWPDLVLVRGGKSLFVELKRDGERPTREQLEWGNALFNAGLNWQLWRPEDWPYIERLLS